MLRVEVAGTLLDEPIALVLRLDLAFPVRGGFVALSLFPARESTSDLR